MKKKLGDKNKTYSEKKLLLGICLIRVKGRFFSYSIVCAAAFKEKCIEMVFYEKKSCFINGCLTSHTHYTHARYF